MGTQTRIALCRMALVLLGCALAGGARRAEADERSSEAGDDRRPNFVLIIADDLGYGELGCQGNPQIPTPHIDSLAATGVRFTAGYVTAPFCSASRAGLMTGRYQTRFGYEFNPIGARNEDPAIGLPASKTTLAEHLRRAGYSTALIGKWHLGGAAAYHPLRRGFDEFFGFLHEGHFYLPPPYRGATTMLRRRALPGGGKGRWISENGSLIYSTHMGYNEPPYDANNPILRGGQPVVESEYLTDAWTREAVDFIDRNASRPFLLCLSYNAVHSPLQATDPYLQRFAHIEDIHRRIFAAMLANLDAGVGAVLAKLREERLDARTLVVFLSDNGGPTRELTSSNAPLRGEKGDLYEGGIRVPFLMRWSGTLPAGRVERRPVISLDIYPTLAAAGAPVPDGRQLDGVNLLPYLTGQNSERPHETLYWRVGRKWAIRRGDWKLVQNGGSREPPRLYNLADDIGEKHNLITAQPDQAAQIQALWAQWNAEQAEPKWGGKRRRAESGEPNPLPR